MTIYPNQLNSTQVIVVKKSMSLFQESPRKSDFMQVQVQAETRCSASKYKNKLSMQGAVAPKHKKLEGRMTTALRGPM